jgi:hypothetical protein
VGEDSPRFPSRRELIRGVCAAAALGLARSGEAGPAAAAPPRRGATMIGVPFERHESVRFGLIGCGGRGSSLLNDMLHVPGVEVRAVCDVVPEKAAKARARVEMAGRKRPDAYTNGDHDFVNLCRRGDLDLVYVATPWRWHVPMAVAAMEGGAHVGCEVPAAVTLEECWALVDTSEATRRHCAILENCCYGWSELLVLNLVRQGLFGELVHAECAYIHDLRSLLFEDEGEGLWRRFEHLRRNGNLYPTHGLGPVALYLGVNRGDRLRRLVSMSSPSLGLQAYRDRTLAAGDPKRAESYACGDLNTSLVQTAKGRTIVLQHGVVSPRPYSRINLLSGTLATFADYPPRIFFDPANAAAPPRKRGAREEWLSLEPSKKKRKKGGLEDRFEAPLWTRLEREREATGGHGGMDYVMSWRLVQCLREGLAPDLDVYDAATWSAPSALSEASVAAGGAPVEFPDFSRGLWAQGRAVTEAVPTIP